MGYVERCSCRQRRRPGLCGTNASGSEAEIFRTKILRKNEHAKRTEKEKKNVTDLGWNNSGQSVDR
jgi:spore coat polysaccharide biosynthesis protein SpsF (cytidylyltransferase family)